MGFHADQEAVRILTPMKSSGRELRTGLAALLMISWCISGCATSGRKQLNFDNSKTYLCFLRYLSVRGFAISRLPD
jgi:hypothetical protein